VDQIAGKPFRIGCPCFANKFRVGHPLDALKGALRMNFQKVLEKYRNISFSERDKGARFERLMQARHF